MTRTTDILAPDAAGFARAAGILHAGGLVAFPTETVYGLGALATDDRAVAGIFDAKERPRFNPLIVHVPDTGGASRLAWMGPEARRLAEAFWPGAMTLVLPLLPYTGLSSLVTAGSDRLAIRVPDHRVARGLLESTGGPVAAPSANPSGRISPTSAAHVIAGLGGRIDAVIDGGDCPVGVESTILGIDERGVTLLRPGGLPAEAIEACLGRRLLSPETVEANRPAAPGMLASHYAPGSAVRLDAIEARDGEFLIGFGPVRGDITLSASGDLTEAAARLFGALHEADATGRPIAVAPIPETGLGRAINDRLRRAAAPRD